MTRHGIQSRDPGWCAGFESSRDGSWTLGVLSPHVGLAPDAGFRSMVIRAAARHPAWTWP
jgi:hypothetical protein